jgi:hypothetical protein
MTNQPLTNLQHDRIAQMMRALCDAVQRAVRSTAAGPLAQNGVVRARVAEFVDAAKRAGLPIERTLAALRQCLDQSTATPVDAVARNEWLGTTFRWVLDAYYPQ